ncbi:MAG: cold shock domain-containing protein [Bacteroidales bacterium]|jgi:cold shock CspA family protein|nr:cold shock domain-containing protein [Bacteroidales bacterium]
MNKKYIGSIHSYNGTFGFISSELGRTFFHKEALNKYVPQIWDEVEFQIEPSQRKKNQIQAYNIKFIKKSDNNTFDNNTINDEYLLGTVKWFDKTKGFGFISGNKSDYYIHVSNIKSGEVIYKNNLVVFKKKTTNNKLSAIDCQLFPNGLSGLSTENQKKVLNKYLSDRHVNSLNYYTIR